MTEIAIRDPQGGTLALAADQTDWTPVQKAALAHIGIADAPPADQQVFMHVCQRTGLDPFNREIYMIPRKERGKNGEPDTVKWTIQTGIDGFRKRAEEHPQYAGTLDPEWCGEDGVWRDAWVDRRPPVAARVRVLRHDRPHPITLPVRFVEFAATFSDGNLQGQWRTKPAHMIAKVAEAAALRKAFPKDFAGLYTDDEMAHVDSPGGRRAATQVSGAAVTAAELTGTKTTAADGAPSAAAPAAAAPAPPGPPLPGNDEHAVEEQTAEDKPPAASPPQIRRLGALCREADVSDRDERLKLTGLLLDRQVGSWDELTVQDASAVIDALTQLKKSGHPDGLAGAVNDLLNLAALREAEQEAAEQGEADDTARGES